MEDIFLLEDPDLEKKYNISVKGAIVSSIKHIRRYKVQVLPKDLWLRILWYAMKGISCQSDHLDICQRISIYDYLKDKDLNDPYLLQFIKETEEEHKNAIL